jgi:hypothetical protein
LRQALFLRPEMLGPSQADVGRASRKSPPPPPTTTVWAIFNGTLGTRPRPVGNDILHIGSRSLGVFTNSLERMSLRDAASAAALHTPAFRFMWISDDDPATLAGESEGMPGLFRPMFEPEELRGGFRRGQVMALRPGGGWRTGPPPLGALADASVQRAADAGASMR